MTEAPIKWNSAHERVKCMKLYTFAMSVATHIVQKTIFVAFNTDASCLGVEY